MIYGKDGLPILSEKEKIEQGLEEKPKVEELAPLGTVKKLYELYLKRQPKGSTSRKERLMLFRFADFVDGVIEGRFAKKE